MEIEVLQNPTLETDTFPKFDSTLAASYMELGPRHRFTGVDTSLYGDKLPVVRDLEIAKTILHLSTVQGIVLEPTQEDLELISTLKTLQVISLRNGGCARIQAENHGERTIEAILSESVNELSLPDDVTRSLAMRSIQQARVLEALSNDIYHEKGQLKTMVSLRRMSELPKNSDRHFDSIAHLALVQTFKGESTVASPNRNGDFTQMKIGQTLIFKGNVGWSEKEMLLHATPNVNMGYRIGSGKITMLAYTVKVG